MLMQFLGPHSGGAVPRFTDQQAGAWWLGALALAREGIFLAFVSRLSCLWLCM